MPKGLSYGKGLNRQESNEPSPNAFKGQKPADASAPRVGPYTPQTSQSNKRGKQG